MTSTMRTTETKAGVSYRINFAGGDKFDGNRWNDLHYTNAIRQAARERTR